MGEAKESEEKRKGGDEKPTFPPWCFSRSHDIADFKKVIPMSCAELWYNI